MSFVHLMDNPPRVTREHITDLVAAQRYRDDMVLAVDIMGGLHVMCAELVDADKLRIVLWASDVRPLIGTVTKHIERWFIAQHTITDTGARLVANLATVRLVGVVSE